MRGDRHNLRGTLSRGTGLALVLFALGCSVYDSSLLEGNAGVPDRPPENTSSLDDSESVAFALRNIFLRQSAEMAARIGLDLDATVTTGPDDVTCDILGVQANNF